ncbi:cyclase family protein [Streptomyces sp. NPDC046939]|uniref:cyclase family protein n=1 Tax=Streptomyces sp. NPDC046939 TaxID=3155376 RepID=UPI0033EE6DB0
MPEPPSPPAAPAASSASPAPSVFGALVAGLRGGAIEAVDLTAPLSSGTPVLELPPQFGQTARFELEEISRYDERGPAWYWNNFRTGEHTGTHFDAPNHWVTGREGADIASVPARQLIAPAVVADFTDEAAKDPDFLVGVADLQAWEQRHGALPEGGWLLLRTGWSSRAYAQEPFLNADESGLHTPGLSAECARWLAERTPVIGLGVETVGTDAGRAHSFEPAFPCHSYLMGSGKYGLTQLRNLDRLPPTGAVLVAGPLPIVTGSGAPARVLALVEHTGGQRS